MRRHLDVDFAQPEGFRPLSLDLRAPDAADAPVVIFLHGGGFRRGSRKVFTPGIADTLSFDRIVDAGFAVASCEYRLSGEARFPAQLEDAAAAIDWMRANQDRYGVDASRLVLWGVSAGATIAALTALDRSDVCGVVDWFGVTDLFAMAAVDTGEEPGATREAQWIGGTAATSPERAAAASVVRRVHAGSPPFHISHGTADAHVPFAQSELLAAALAGVGADVEFVPVPGGQHFWRGVDDVRPLFDRALAFAARVTAGHGPPPIE